MIAGSEYAGRRSRLASLLQNAGLDGAIIVSRGGSTLDRYANVLYLTGHYQSYSYLPDAPSLFSARAHTVLVLAADGSSVLCVSAPEYNRTDISVDEVRYSGDFVATLSRAVRDLRLSDKRLGLIGSDVLPVFYWRLINDQHLNVDWVDCDDLLAELRRIKSPAEQKIIREAAAIHRRGTTALIEAIGAGRSEAELAAILTRAVVAEGGGIYFIAISSGEGTNRWASNALPGFSRRKLESGDLLRFDAGIVFQGYLSDFGRSMVAGRPSAAQNRLLAALHGGLDAAIDSVHSGATIASVVAAGEAVLSANGVVAADDGSGRIVSSFPVHWGHGLGLGWERPWMTENEEMTIEPGMVLAIERALSLQGVGTAAAEQNILVLDDSTEILTQGPAGRWS